MSQAPQQQSPGVAPAPHPQPVDKAAADKAKAEDKEKRAAASIGAQIILDYNEDGSVGARGGGAGTIEENMALRDAYLVSQGLDPIGCSGPPPGKPKEPPPEAPAVAAAKPQPKATRASSLAVGA